MKGVKGDASTWTAVQRQGFLCVDDRYFFLRPSSKGVLNFRSPNDTHCHPIAATFTELPVIRYRPAASQCLHVRRNQEWALDFIAGTIGTGRGIRVLTVVDAFTRECLGLEVDSSLSSRRVTRVLEQIIDNEGCPKPSKAITGPN